MKTVTSIFILLILCTTSIAQPEQQNVTATILHLDSAFWNAYNNCDTSHFKDFLTDDVEFYHDKGGITLGATALIQSLNKNICGNTNYHLRREAIAGTVHVYPMLKNNEIYGALIAGEHLFYITSDGKPEYLDGHASFMQLWLLKDNVWKMARILSFDHHAPEPKILIKEIELPAQKLDQLAGTYKSVQSGTMTVVRENKILLLKGGNTSYMLFPQSDNLFFTKDRDLTFLFVKDTTGKPLKMIVNEHGTKADELVFEK